MENHSSADEVAAANTLRELQAMDLTVRSRPKWRLPY